MADCPPYYFTDPPAPSTSLDKTSIYTADCPLTLSGSSAVHLRQPTRDNNASGTISNPTCGLSGPPWRTVRSSRIQSTRDDNVSGQNPRLYCGLSAPKWRTVRSTTLQTHQNRLPLWTNFKSIRRTVRSQTADRQQFNSAKRRLWINFKLYCGLSGPPYRTALSLTLSIHQR